MKDTQKRELHLRCDCSQMHFLSVEYWPDDPVLYFTISVWPAGLRERARAVWRALRGSRFWASEEIVLDREGVQAVIRLADDALGSWEQSELEAASNEALEKGEG